MTIIQFSLVTENCIGPWDHHSEYEFLLSKTLDVEREVDGAECVSTPEYPLGVASLYILLISAFFLHNLAFIPKAEMQEKNPVS